MTFLRASRAFATANAPKNNVATTDAAQSIEWPTGCPASFQAMSPTTSRPPATMPFSTTGRSPAVRMARLRSPKNTLPALPTMTAATGRERADHHRREDAEVEQEERRDARDRGSAEALDDARDVVKDADRRRRTDEAHHGELRGDGADVHVLPDADAEDRADEEHAREQHDGLDLVEETEAEEARLGLLPVRRRACGRDDERDGDPPRGRRVDRDRRRVRDVRRVEHVEAVVEQLAHRRRSAGPPRVRAVGVVTPVVELEADDGGDEGERARCRPRARSAPNARSTLTPTRQIKWPMCVIEFGSTLRGMKRMSGSTTNFL